jgi:potassium efflux system protein
MKKFIVMSDLYFAIDETLRENGVEIPFPQRDVHVKSWVAREKTGDSRDDD